jgi:arylsulfatase A-like enzyme
MIASQPQRARVFVNLVTTLAFATWLGLADFVLFSVWGTGGHLEPYGLIKPSFWGPSYLLIQLTAFFVAGLLLAGGFAFFALFRRFWVTRLISRVAAPLAVAALAAVICGLRFWRFGDSTLRLVLLCCVALAIIVVAALAARSPRFDDGGAEVQPTIVVGLVAVVIPFLSAFFVSDLPIPFFSVTSDSALRGGDRPNVLLVVLDTVRVDGLSCFDRHSGSTPSIDRIAREGVLFERAYSAAPWTVPSHGAMFTGLQTGVHRAEWGHTRLDADFTTLAEVMAREGYLTAGFSENPFIGHSTQMSQGFSTFFEAWRRPLLVRAVTRVAARAGLFRERMEYSDTTFAVFRRWHQDVSESGRSFFAYLNLMAAHLPRYPRLQSYSHATLKEIQPVNLVPEKFYLPAHRLDDEALAAMRSIYDEEIEYLDGIVGELLEYLERSGVLDRTILIFTSDHGENFGEHGFIEHQFCLYDQLIRVPLIIRYPAALSPRRVAEPVSTVALAATVSKLTGINPEEDLPGFRRVPLHQVVDDQLVIAEAASAAGMLRGVLEHLAPDFDFSAFDRDASCVVFGDFKLIVDSMGGRELYNVREDPEELTDIAPLHPEIVEALAAVYVSPLLSEAGKPTSTTGIEIDSETLEALRELGYVQ